MNRQFPPEIIQLIVEASLNRYDLFRSYHNYSKPRYATLKSYSLLNSTWCRASQAELVKWVEIRTEDMAEKFLEVAEQRGGTLRGVKDMFVDSAYFTESTIAKLLRCAPQVANLYIIRGSVDIHDLARLQQLRRLEMIGCFIVGSPSSSLLRLPHLQRLSLYNCRLNRSATHFLTPTFLPRLRHLHVPSCALADSLVQQLEIITCNEGYEDYTVLARAESLLLLPLPLDTDERLDMLSKLPSLPPFLHIDPMQYGDGVGSDWDQLLAVALEALLATTKTGLRVILLNDYGIGDRIDVLVQRFQERGVRVQLVDKYLEFKGAILEMEKLRAKKKRAAELKELGAG